MKEMAEKVLRTDKIPSSEAAHTALLFSHVAWNSSIGFPVTDKQYKIVLKKLEKSNPNLWNEHKYKNEQEMISELIEYKKKYYKQDFRKIMVCGIRDGNVHVEWSD